MCGRFSITDPDEALRALFGYNGPPIEMEPRYNVAPTQVVPVVRLNRSGGRGIAKLFPAHVGGPAYLRSILAVLPGARIVPTGGIALGQVRDYLDAGAYAVGVGSDLVKSPDPAAAVRELLGER